MLYLQVASVSSANLIIKDSIVFNSTRYNLTAISYCREDHYFCQVFVSSQESNCPQGWYLYDGLQNHGCSVFVGTQPLSLDKTFIEILVYDQLPMKAGHHVPESNGLSYWPIQIFSFAYNRKFF